MRLRLGCARLLGGLVRARQPGRAVTLPDPPLRLGLSPDGRPSCLARPQRARAVSAPTSQQVEHNQPDNYQGKEDEQVRDDFHRRLQHPHKRFGERPRQRRPARDQGLLGREPAGRRHVLDELGATGLGSSGASAVATSSATRTRACRPAICHAHRSGMPRQVASTSHRRSGTAWIGISSGGNRPRRRRRMRQPRAVGLGSRCDRPSGHLTAVTVPLTAGYSPPSGSPVGGTGPSVDIV